VGKDHHAAAAAVSIAGRGRTRAALSTDPATSLGDVLGIPVGDQEREVEPGLWAR